MAENDKYTVFQRLQEATKAFRDRPLRTPEPTGEGIEDISLADAFGSINLQSFNMFYDSYLKKQYSNEIDKIKNYREMESNAEIGDIVEDATNESTQLDEEGRIIHLKIMDSSISSNTNKIRNLQREFDELFYNRIKISNILWDMFRSYLVDGRLYYERVINPNKKTNGITMLKKLPTETMDFEYDYRTGKIKYFMQYMSPRAKMPSSFQEAQKSNDVVVFYPDQIGFVDYGVYGISKKDIYGYLEKARIPYNQLKMLETSVIIYRIVRAPERFVFRIDTGAMPKDKAMKFVEKVKQKMTKKQTYDANTGTLSNSPDVLSIGENFFLPQCLRTKEKVSLLDGRTLTLDEIIKEHDEGKKHEVYSIDQSTGNIVRGKVKWAGITRKNAKLVRVHLDNGEYVDCTPDHKFCVWKDESKTEIIEVEAQNLTEEMDIVENDANS